MKRIVLFRNLLRCWVILMGISTTGSARGPLFGAGPMWLGQDPMPVAAALLQDSGECKLYVVASDTGSTIPQVDLYLDDEGSLDEFGIYPPPLRSLMAVSVGTTPPADLLVRSGSDRGPYWQPEWWVTAEGYSWKKIKLNNRAEGPFVALLERSASLRVKTSRGACIPNAEIALFPAACLEGPSGSIYKRIPAASRPIDAKGELEFASLPPGKYVVRLQVRPGPAYSVPAIVAERSVALNANETTDVVFPEEPVPSDADQRCRVTGGIALPPGTHGLLSHSPRIRLDAKRIRGWVAPERLIDVQSTTSWSHMNGSGVLTWDAGRLVPGEYEMEIEPILFVQELVVPATPELQLRTEIPMICRLNAAIEAPKGSSVGDVILKTTDERYLDDGLLALIDLIRKPGTEGEYSALVVPGEYELVTWENDLCLCEHTTVDSEEVTIRATALKQAFVDLQFTYEKKVVAGCAGDVAMESEGIRVVRVNPGMGGEVPVRSRPSFWSDAAQRIRLSIDWIDGEYRASFPSVGVIHPMPVTFSIPQEHGATIHVPVEIR